MSQIFKTPILFLIFNRPDTTQIVFDRIREIKPKYLYVAADGPRINKINENIICDETRAIINKVDWDCEVKTLFRTENLGCGIAVSSAISWFFENVDNGIILEDDCLPEKSFFYFCAELLEKYEYNDNVMLVGGSNHLNNKINVEKSYYFSQYPHIWGWATWKRAWSLYDYNLNDLNFFMSKKLDSIYVKKYQRRYIVSKLKSVRNKEINTWDYQWVYSILNNDGLAITPKFNMVINLGFRNESTHNFLKDPVKENEFVKTMDFPLSHPEIQINKTADLITYNNIYGLNLIRLMRLIKYNNFDVLLNYIFKIIRKKIS